VSDYTLTGGELTLGYEAADFDGVNPAEGVLFFGEFLYPEDFQLGQGTALYVPGLSAINIQLEGDSLSGSGWAQLYVNQALALSTPDQSEVTMYLTSRPVVPTVPGTYTTPFTFAADFYCVPPVACTQDSGTQVTGAGMASLTVATGTNTDALYVSAATYAFSDPPPTFDHAAVLAVAEPATLYLCAAGIALLAWVRRAHRESPK